ncbi:LEPR-XLL domain-containing protein [sulfur-oxidizing endosymbiont of Gigantopelta aegis]|uniref:LEPR-XLL domain-containing protein n=1 Tax=sulfur-oxidizing endosymbiont of Gigantopelta aegis TaxID=2794934 RepID=UPI0018DE7061|nr:LEPR-XLL domain-containing protein [sulfur-oxidizing endosymbiont of Gigantopelta aegis]
MSKQSKKQKNNSKPTAFDSQKEFQLETLEPRMLLSADGLLPPDVLEQLQSEDIVEELVADETLLAAIMWLYLTGHTT